jgi:hypothetical protein
MKYALHKFMLSAGLQWYSNTDVLGAFATSTLTHARGKEFQCCIKRTSLLPLALRTRLYISTDTTGTALYKSKSSPSQKCLQHIACRHLLQ